MGPLQEISHVDIMRPVTRYARTARVAEHVLRELDEAIACASGDFGEPGPSYLEVPTDVLRTRVAPNLIPEDWLAPKSSCLACASADALEAALATIRAARPPLVVSGRGARRAGASRTRQAN